MTAEKRLVLIVWNDAWQDQDNFASSHGIALSHRPMVVQTLGWLIHDDEAGVSVVNERSMDEGSEVYRGRTFIPRPMIISVTDFKLAVPRKKKAPQDDKPGSASIESPAT
jgi:hypothetical protein